MTRVVKLYCIKVKKFDWADAISYKEAIIIWYKSGSVNLKSLFLVSKTQLCI